MAVALAVIGLVLYARFEAHLDQTLDDGLRARADDVSALFQRGDANLAASGRSVLSEYGESFAQILDSTGTVLDGSPKLQTEPLLTQRMLVRARRETLIFTRRNPLVPRDPARLLATPIAARERRLIVVVGVAADDRDGQLASLALLLAIGGLSALLLASLAGYGVASAALRPVDAMRRKADEITEEDPGERLPVGRADDEITRLGTTLNRMLSRLERAVRRERAFVADASHELRTPLAILKTEIELALRGERSPGELRDALRSAAVETDRLAELAEALLVIARAEDGGLPLAPAPLDANELLAGAALRFAARVSAADRSIAVEEGPPAPLTADARRLEQALDNLVENALRHGDGDIRLAAAANGGAVELHVYDEGPGFPPDFIAEAFERFTRADQARTRGGAGLGLAIVRMIARAHGGDARAANDPGGGARVVIELPVAGPAGASVRSPGA